MTKGEWLKQNKIHICKPLFDYDEEVDEEWIKDWETIMSAIPKIEKEQSNDIRN